MGDKKWKVEPDLKPLTKNWGNSIQLGCRAEILQKGVQEQILYIINVLRILQILMLNWWWTKCIYFNVNKFTLKSNLSNTILKFWSSLLKLWKDDPPSSKVASSMSTHSFLET